MSAKYAATDTATIYKHTFTPPSRQNDQFKKLLIESVPGIEPVLKVLLQEDGNALESASKSLGRATQTVSDIGTKVSGIGSKVSDLSGTVTGFFGGSKAPEAPAVPLKSEYHV